MKLSLPTTEGYSVQYTLGTKTLKSGRVIPYRTSKEFLTKEEAEKYSAQLKQKGATNIEIYECML